MKTISRREFLLMTGGAAASLAFRTTERIVMTVNGPIPVSALGRTLVHEHFLVDFIGADKVNPGRWVRAEVLKKALPYLIKVKRYDIKTVFDCTPAYLGRDVELLKMLSDKSGIQIVTNTGYYGAVDNKYLPRHAFTESAEQLAERWNIEFFKGIEGSGVKPGFIKIGVNPGSLSDLHRKIVKAAAITHKATGLTICSHTGPALPAFQELDILNENNVEASGFVWVHAQEEKDKSNHQKFAAKGGWISLDGIGWGDHDVYADSLHRLKESGLLNRVLISHDAGWYKPGEADGGDFIGYTQIFTELLPKLKEKGFTDEDFERLLVQNPAEAFAINS